MPTKIGILAEKTFHAHVKQHIEPNVLFHEIKHNNYVLDIFYGDRIIEIQSKQFFKLIPKLNTFIDTYPITIVHPIPHIKYLSWFDFETQSYSEKRKSPKVGRMSDGIEELYSIKQLLSHPNLSIHFIYFDVLETRYLNGWSTDKKKGSQREDRIPLEYIKTEVFNHPEDYDQFLPIDLKEVFHSKDLMDALKINAKKAQLILNVLQHLNRIEQIGKEGRYKVYKKRDIR
jgi:hypothetical protein